MGSKLRTPDAIAAEIAAREWGVVDHEELVAAGLGDQAIRYRVRRGRLHVVHRGVYAVGHARLTRRGEWMAAVKAAGDDALLSHLSATALWGLMRSRRGAVNVLVPKGSAASRPGIKLHETRQIHPEDRARRDRIPVTSVPRTLLDLAATLEPDRLMRLFEDAIRLELLRAPAMNRLLDRSNGRAGVKQIRHLMEHHFVIEPDTKSYFEDEFGRFCRERGLPIPVFNCWVGPYLVDAYWPQYKLIVELDSRGFHGHWEARERDSVRDGDLMLLEHRVLRVTWRRLTRERDKLERVLRKLLRAAPATEGGPQAIPN